MKSEEEEEEKGLRETKFIDMMKMELEFGTYRYSGAAFDEEGSGLGLRTIIGGSS